MQSLRGVFSAIHESHLTLRARKTDSKTFDLIIRVTTLCCNFQYTD